MTRKLFIIATALLLGILCSCSVDDPLPVAPVLEDGEVTGGVHGANRLGGNGVELVRRKVKCLYMMGGVFGDAIESIEFNLAQGMDFAQAFFHLWPADVDIIMSPGEVGDGIEYKPEQVIADIDWTDRHPIKQVYLNCNCNTGQKMWDPLTVINAVEGNSLFTLSERGTVTLGEHGETFFTPSPTGNVRYHLPKDAAWSADMLERIRSFNKVRSIP